MKLAREVELTDDQFELLNTSTIAYKHAGHILAEMLHRYSEERARATNDMWNSVAKIAGYESLAQARKEGVTFEINWVMRRIEVKLLDDSAGGE